jgi:hypothetical protein
MDPGIFQQAIRSATVTYSIPFLFAVSLLFAVLCLGGSLLAEGPLRWLFGSLGTLGAVAGFVIGLHGVFFRPDLLRSEAHEFRMTIANIVGDADVDQGIRAELVRQLQLEPPRERRNRGSKEA